MAAAVATPILQQPSFHLPNLALQAPRGSSWITGSQKTFTAPSYQTATKPSTTGAVTVTVDVSQEITKVSANEYGNNSNPFMGEISNVPTLITNITDLAPVLSGSQAAVCLIYISGIRDHRHRRMHRHNCLTLTAPPQQLVIGMVTRWVQLGP